MGLRSAVGSLTFAVRPLPEQGATARLAASRPPEVATIERPAIDLNAVAGRFLDDVGRGEVPSAADWNKIPWCLWTTSPAIAQHDPALQALLDRVVRMVRLERKRPYRQLASAYLADFAADRPGLEQICGVLRGGAAAAGAPWDKLQAKYAVFDGAEAAARIARLALKERTSVHSVFEAAGISGPLLGGEFARAVHDEGLRIISRTSVPAASEHVGTIRRWSLRSDLRLMFENSKVEVARAVVHPFGDRIPAPADRDVVLSFIISQFGDPRVSSGRWIGMDDVARVLRRWLIGQSLRQFLDVVDRIAPDHMWKYRRAFWQAYYEADLLLNAWVVFGSDGAEQAKRAFGNDVPFGTFRPGGRRQILPGHAVLLLDFGPCIIADWSHSGRCNIWRNDDRTRPKILNASSYISDEIERALPKDSTERNLNCHGIFSHHGSANYVWQNRVAERLHALIGVRVQETAYQVQ
jgi:EH_Signature domain